MIFDRIEYRNNYKDMPYLYRALKFLSEMDPEKLPVHGAVLESDKLFCNFVELDSREESECRYEAHRRYIDLHYIIEGTERIGTADINKVKTLVPYSDEKDIGFYEGKADGYMNLTPGCFMVCYPSDAHKVAIKADESEHIKKIVFKISVDVD